VKLQTTARCGDYFSMSKLKPEQKGNFDNLVEDCGLEYDEYDLKVWSY